LHKLLLYLTKATCEKEDAEDITLEDIDIRVVDDIKAQMRNAGIIKGKQKSKIDPNDEWKILL